MSVLVLVQGNPLPEKNDILLQYQQVARAIIAKHGVSWLQTSEAPAILVS
jgi:hypothetical protein